MFGGYAWREINWCHLCLGLPMIKEYVYFREGTQYFCTLYLFNTGLWPWIEPCLFIIYQLHNTLLPKRISFLSVSSLPPPVMVVSLLSSTETFAHSLGKFSNLMHPTEHWKDDPDSVHFRVNATLTASIIQDPIRNQKLCCNFNMHISTNNYLTVHKFIV